MNLAVCVAARFSHPFYVVTRLGPAFLVSSYLDFCGQILLVEVGQ
jgi:hypothetical protein